VHRILDRAIDRIGKRLPTRVQGKSVVGEELLRVGEELLRVGEELLRAGGELYQKGVKQANTCQSEPM
jgi:hypothetical protein